MSQPRSMSDRRRFDTSLSTNAVYIRNFSSRPPWERPTLGSTVGDNEIAQDSCLDMTGIRDGVII